MEDSAIQAASTLDAIGQQYEAIAHNLANISTAGYKRQSVVFSKALAAQMTDGGDPSAPTQGTVQASMSLDFRQGNLVKTDRPLDVALNGPGLFVLDSPEGPRYTRCGMFTTNATGQLVDSSGRTVESDGGPITLPATASQQNINITPEGSVEVGGTSVGKLKIVVFKDTSVLSSVGDHCYSAPKNVTPDSATQATTTVSQGFQESSNVNAVEELVGLITATRLYEANIKAMTSQDEKSKSLLQVAMG
jgi:flagellar basal-body rod protein FlgF